MNSSGVLLVIAGAWVVVQVTGGNALARLGVGADLSTSKAAPKVTAPQINKSSTVDRSARATVGEGTWV